MDDYRNSPTIKFYAGVFHAHKCPPNLQFFFFLNKYCLKRLKLKWLERPSVNLSNLSISKAYFAANKMNSTWKVKEK